MDINVTVDVESFKNEMEAFAKQIPYATSRAINAVAKDCQLNIRNSIRENFHVRKPFVLNAVKIKFSHKTNLEAIVKMEGPKSDPSREFLSKFEDGGTKQSISGGRVAVPSENIRTTPESLIPKSQRPRNLAGAFKMVTRNGKELLMQRIGSGKNGLQLAYSLVTSVRIPAKLQFEVTALRTVDALWERRWTEEWDKAVNSAYSKEVTDEVLGLFTE